MQDNTDNVTTEEIISFLQSEKFKHLQKNIIYNPDTSKIVWMKCGGKATALFRPNSLDQLTDFLKAFPFKKYILPIGNGSNIIIRDNGFIGVLIQLTGELAKIEMKQESDYNIITCGCGINDIQVANFCLKEEIKGFEFLSTIPGTVGGNIRMNASCYGSEISDNLITVEYIDFDGNKFTKNRNEIDFQYRNNPMPRNIIFTKSKFRAIKGNKEKIKEDIDEMQLKRTLTQPQKCRTSGSTFVNPPNNKAWDLIDKCGLKGKRIGGAEISTKHANFIINQDKATSKDIEDLGNFARKKIEEKFNIDMKWEIEFFGK